jgi:DNA mismatch repair ATPase MutS
VLAALALFLSSAVVPFVAVLVLNVAVRYATDFQIGTIARSFRQCAPLIATAESLGFLGGDDIDPIVSPLRTDVPALARLKLISRWVNGDPFMLSVNADPLVVPFSDLVAAVYEYLNLAFLLDATGVYLAIKDLSRYGDSLARATAATGDVDAAISIASFRAGRSDWTRPDFRTAEAATELTDLRHPLVNAAVPNSITIQPGRGVVITGSNMSGKSTFLRTVGVNAVLAQTIHTCLAQQYRAPVFHVRSCIGRADDLLAGKSYYIVEVEALLELVRVSDDTAPHLFLLDELFRGTSAVERIAAGEAVLVELLRARRGTPKPHVVLAATHDGELVDLVSETFDAYHFGDSVGPDGLMFDHRLQHGPATTRNAIALLRLHGAPETLLAQAMTTAETLDRQRGTRLVAR